MRLIIKHAHAVRRGIMIETCETSLTCFNETTDNCSIGGKIDCMRWPANETKKRRYRDLYKCKFELTRRKTEEK